MSTRLARKVLTFMRFAEELGKLSTCKRLGCGCVVATSDLSSVLAIGYNGPPTGTPNDACRDTEGSCGCAHAEVNACVKLTGGDNLLMLCTTSPCERCGGYIANCGRVDGVIFTRQYRDRLGMDSLIRAGVAVGWLDELLDTREERWPPTDLHLLRNDEQVSSFIDVVRIVKVLRRK